MLRKVLKISKTVVKVFSLTVFFTCAFYANGEDSISMPSSPAMPSVSVPQISNGFYIPGSSDFYTGQKSATAAAATNFSASANSSPTNSSTQSANATQIKTTSQIENSQTAQDITSNLVNSALSTSLAGSLTDSGNSLINSSQILNSLSGLLSGKTVTTGTDQLFTTSAQSLEQASKTVKNDSSSVQNSSSPSILRFLINGTDMIPFCKTVFFSSAETDGSFLLTGDCRYELNGSTRNETFYLLFRSTGSKNASQEFSVTASVFQDKEDSSTYLYALTKIGNLTAQKTGNLISLKSKENGTVLNMLLSF